MGISYRKKILLKEVIMKKCENCNKVFAETENFCTVCGSKLSTSKTQVFANMGKNGITSYSYKLPTGQTINSKGHISIPLGNGLSYKL